MSEFIDGATAMQKSVSHKLGPLLKSIDYEPYAIAMIFKDIGLLDDLTDEDIQRLQHEATSEFLRQERIKYKYGNRN